LKYIDYLTKIEFFKTFDFLPRLQKWVKLRYLMPPTMF